MREGEGRTPGQGRERQARATGAMELREPAADSIACQMEKSSSASPSRRQSPGADAHPRRGGAPLAGGAAVVVVRPRACDLYGKGEGGAHRRLCILVNDARRLPHQMALIRSRVGVRTGRLAICFFNLRCPGVALSERLLDLLLLLRGRRGPRGGKWHVLLLPRGPASTGPVVTSEA